MKQNLSVLGSTGSIGTQTLDVARRLGLHVCALAAHSNVKLLENQIREFKPQLVAVFDLNAANALRVAVADTETRVVQGPEGLCEAASLDSVDLVCNAVVGMIGLQPTLAALAAKKDVALSNKEALVAGGALVTRAARENGVRVLPVDSEHSAIFQCLQGCPEARAVNRLVLTASGGPFYGRMRAELEQVTPEMAMQHPTWSMGAKITIDSATMMNKGLEVIEASWLFNMPQDKIDVLVHRESVVHSMVEYKDGSVLAQMGVPDMRGPIQYAITYPQRELSPVKQLSLTDYGSLTFSKPDEETFTCLAACRRALTRGGLAPAAANGANEAANLLFRQGKIRFLDIGALVSAALEQEPDRPGVPTLEEVLAADLRARKFAQEELC